MTERRHLDAYGTPPDLCAAIVAWTAARIVAPSTLLEPSVGEGPFVVAAREQWPGVQITGVDCNAIAKGLPLCDRHVVADFAQWRTGEHTDPLFDVAVMNPPFSHWQEHVTHALGLCSAVVALLRLAVLEGQRRRPWWSEHVPEAVAVLPKRPSFTGNGTDAAAYAVVLWNRETPEGETRAGWLDWGGADA